MFEKRKQGGKKWVPVITPGLIKGLKGVFEGRPANYRHLTPRYEYSQVRPRG